ncbi:MAG: BON domain-containing protein, partial [Alphaproteobacteria bacterium]|nr:BON domain-containing protein [Alphaproteobacteria bacterium]
IDDRELNLFKIDVTTDKGIVQLSGVVSSAAIKARASQVAAATEGVKAVRNNLIVRP